MTEMIINEPCGNCECSQCVVQTFQNGWMSVKCAECGTIIAEGYSDSVWKLIEDSTHA